MKIDFTKLRHTICFCLCKDQVLMLYRYNQPNQFFWNGVGGKIEAGESPLQGVFRETMEETGIDLAKVLSVNFTGIVTWLDIQNKEVDGGMYAFVAHLNKKHLLGKKEIPEGILEYKNLSWVLDKENKQVVENIPHFLPRMLKSTKIYHYNCCWQGRELLKVTSQLLPPVSF